jgi:hypothetical protein
MNWQPFQERLMDLIIWVGGVLNAPFMSAFLSALAGAGAGVLGAQMISERASRKRDLLQDFRHTNAAIALAFTLCNSVLAARRQYILPLSLQFETDRSNAIAAIEKARKGQGPVHLHYQADFNKFPVPELPLDALKNFLYGSSSIGGRGLALLAMVEQSILEFRTAISIRNELIDEIASSNAGQIEMHRRYFGIVDENGHTNQVYPDSVHAVSSYSGDVAFFCALLAEDLIEHCNKVRVKLKKDFRHEAPRTSTVDFSAARSSGLIPPDDEYQSWLQGFTIQPEAAP